jgi:hypothetical protein
MVQKNEWIYKKKKKNIFSPFRGGATRRLQAIARFRSHKRKFHPLSFSCLVKNRKKKETREDWNGITEALLLALLRGVFVPL